MQGYSNYRYREEVKIRGVDLITGAGEFTPKRGGSGIGLNHAEYLLKKLDSHYPAEGLISNQESLGELLAHQYPRQPVHPSWMPKSVLTHDSQTFKNQIAEKNVTFGKDHHSFGHPRPDFEDSQHSVSVKEFDSQSGAAANFCPQSGHHLLENEVRILSTQIQNLSCAAEEDFTNHKYDKQIEYIAGFSANAEVERLSCTVVVKDVEIGKPYSQEAENLLAPKPKSSTSESDIIDSSISRQDSFNIRPCIPGDRLVQSQQLIPQIFTESKILSQSEVEQKNQEEEEKRAVTAGLKTQNHKDPMAFSSLDPQKDKDSTENAITAFNEAGNPPNPTSLSQRDSIQAPASQERSLASASRESAEPVHHPSAVEQQDHTHEQQQQEHKTQAEQQQNTQDEQQEHRSTYSVADSFWDGVRLGSTLSSDRDSTQTSASAGTFRRLFAGR